MILTRYLYFIDDVFYTLENCLVEKREKNELLFWLSEIYYSGFKQELLKFIEYIYYKYYFINYPKLEKKISILKTKEFNEEIIIYIFKNLFTKKHYNVCLDSYKELSYLNDFSLFSLFSLCDKINLETINVKKPKYKIKDCIIIDEILTKKNIEFIFNNKIKNVKKREINQLKHILYSFIHKKDLLNRYLLLCLKGLLNIDVLIKLLIILNGYDERNKNEIYNFKKHNYNILYNENKYLKFISLYELYYRSSKLPLKKIIFIKETKKELEYFRQTNKEVEYLFETLERKRLYSVLKRENNNDEERKYIQMKGLWEYYVFGCPLWEERIKKYNIIKNPDYKCEFDLNKETYEMILFKDDIDDNNKEEFYEKYNYELQEQKINIINKALSS